MITEEWIRENPEKFAAALEAKWAEDPSLMEQAFQANPGAFLTAGTESRSDIKLDTLHDRELLLAQAEGGGFRNSGGTLSVNDDIVQNAIDRANNAGINLVENVGGDRYRIADIGLNVTPEYTDALTTMGLLPELDFRGWEKHRGGDGTFSISYHEPETVFADTLFKSIVPAAVGMLTTGALGGGLVAGALGGGTSATFGSVASGGGFDPEEIAKGALTGAASGWLSEGGLSELVGDNAFTQVYDSPNVVGAFTKGSVNDALISAAQGDFDLEDSALAGLVNVGTRVVGDIFADADQTKDGSITQDTTVDGVRLGDMPPLERAQAFARLSNSTDLYGLLGEGGLLDTIGISGVGYMPTDYIGDAMNFLGIGDPVEGVRKAQEERQQKIDDLSPALSAEQRAEAIAGIDREYEAEIQRFDERDFIIDRTRGEGEQSGIWEFNDVLPSSGGTTFQDIILGGSPEVGGGPYIPDLPEEEVEQPKSVSSEEEELPAGPVEEEEITDVSEDDTITEGEDELVVGSGAGALPDSGSDDDLPDSEPDEPLPGTEDPVIVDSPPEFEDNEDLPEELNVSSSGGGTSQTLVGGVSGGEFEPEWTDLFPYTKLTPLQKEKLRPYAQLLSMIRGFRQ